MRAGIMRPHPRARYVFLSGCRILTAAATQINTVTVKTVGQKRVLSLSQFA
jgi:hypothetical protein